MKISYIYNKKTKNFFKKWRTRGYDIISSFLLSQFDFHKGLIKKNEKLFWKVMMKEPYKKTTAIKNILKELLNKGNSNGRYNNVC